MHTEHPNTRRMASGARWFFFIGVALVGLQLAVPDGIGRALSSLAVNVPATIAVFWGIRKNRPTGPLPWLALGVSLGLFASSNIGWAAQFAGYEWGVLFQGVVKLLAMAALVVAIAAFVYEHRPLQRRDAIVDAALVVSGGALLVWQWWLLTQGADTALLLDRALVPMVLAGLTVVLTIISVRLFDGRGLGSVSLLSLLAAGSMTLAAQAFLTLSDPVTGPPRLSDATWLMAAVFVGVAALHPSMAGAGVLDTSSRTHVTTRLLLVGAALVANPVIVWLHLLQDSTDRQTVILVAIAVGVVTLFGLWRVGELITDRDQIANALELSEHRFRSLVQHASDVIAVVDQSGRFTYVSPSVSSVLGYSTDRLIGGWSGGLVHADDEERFAVFLEHAGQAESDARESIEVRIRHRRGAWRHAEVLGVNLTDDPGLAGVVLTIRDMTDRVAFEAQLQHMASHDALTGLANRVLFRDRVSHALDRAKRQNSSVAVIFVDLDDFKTVNDSLGHHAGDELLRVVGARTLDCLREADSAARLGGDEFAVLLEDLHDVGDAVVIAERILLAMRQPVYLEDRHIQVGATLGVAMSNPDSTAEDLLRNADTAMFDAKTAGKGRLEVFRPEMHHAARSRFDMKSALQRAIDRHEFVVYYQPIFSLEGGAVRGVEALLRWEHPERGVVLPDEFIPLIEETGQIVQIGRWVLSQAFRQAGKWQAGRAQGDRLSVSVNLSVRQFQHPDLATDVAAALDGTGLSAHDVVMEITESVFLGDSEATMQQLERLRELGVRLAIDDFGTGYSALNYLQRFRADIVKVDKSFIDSLGSGGDDRTLTRGIVTLAHALDIETVAEGVERSDQVIDLRNIECGLAQGFYFAEPMPAPEATAVLLADALAFESQAG